MASRLNTGGKQIRGGDEEKKETREKRKDRSKNFVVKNRFLLHSLVLVDAMAEAALLFAAIDAAATAVAAFSVNIPPSLHPLLAG